METILLTLKSKVPEQVSCKTSAAAWRRQMEKRREKRFHLAGMEVRHRVGRNQMVGKSRETQGAGEGVLRK